MSTTAAQRQALRRQRARRGRIVLPIEIDEIEVTASLVALGRLDEENIDDRHRIAAAISGWINDIARNNHT